MAITKEKIEEFYKFMSPREFEYHIHISPLNKYIYFEVPKAACSTIKATLQELEAKTLGLEIPSKEMSVIHNKKLSPLKSPSDIGLDEFLAMLNAEEIIKFCFVRNPYTRVMSAFLSKLSWKNSSYKQQINQILGLTEETITFAQFIEAISKTSPKEMNPHWRNQTHQLFGELVNYNFIGRLENLNQDLEQILKKIYKQEEGRINNSGRLTGSEKKLEEYYDEEIEKKVRKIYEEDFKRFNYPEELSKLKQ
ncbi:MAG: sulfotransferase family 2 domain-containing protein [Gomphosphaeria aponina SAG 52.96 = DSM 107014]|uniref:Sulfotransferase family 2 domain-containing protein n=1 Tax=Gomphosphaeria aponina SAG 52.96 = DSM 107014 TaxID=1521640 RepID=A0A941GQI0_9CHRO|nr:sulfotransferase family 2 domain-containing protein [Gomphosphaeria aponina SAG 52.96 = DSM 107014]